MKWSEGIAVMRLGRSAACDFFVLTVSESGVPRGSRAAVAPINCAFASAPTAREAYARVVRDPHGCVLSSRWHGRLAYLEAPVVASPPAKRPADGEFILFTVTFCANSANDLTCPPSYINILKS